MNNGRVIGRTGLACLLGLLGGTALAVPPQSVEVAPRSVLEHPVTPLPQAPVDRPAVARPIVAQPVIAQAAPVCCPAPGNTPSQQAETAMKSAYQGVFYANNYSYLGSPHYSGPYFPGDQFKGIADGRLDLGGEYRTRYHHENNHRGLGLTGVDDQFWLSRLRLFSNYRITENIRFFGEYIYADSGGETFAPLAIEENRGDAQNLFLEVKLLESNNGTLAARVGRQELLLGNQRLVSPLDWGNTRRTFDGYRLTYAADDGTLDLFYTNPVARVAATAGSNDWDSADSDQHFYGAYLTQRLTERASLDTYYLGYDNENVGFSFHTLGNRLYGTGDIFLYELEGGVQFGDNSDGSAHDAGFMTAGLGRKMDLGDWKPTVWFWYDWASGSDDAPVGVGDDSFHHLFPLAHKYNGFIDLFGRRNLHDVNAQFITPLSDRVSALLWYHYFFLDQATTPYAINMAPFNTVASANSKDLGHEIDALFTVTLDPRNSVLLGYSYFDAGDYYKTTPGVPTSQNADFFYFQYQTQF